MRRSLLVLSLFVAACGGGGSSTPDAHTGDDAPDSSVPDASIDPDAGPMSGVVQCPTALPAPTQGSCDVAAGTGTAVVVRGNILGNGVTYLDGSVAYDGDLITYVGCNPPANASATVITCAGAAVSPGLINAHDHYTYDNRAPLAATATRFDHRNQWRDVYSTPGDQMSKANGATEWNEVRAVMSGETSSNSDTISSTATPGMLRNLDFPSAADQALGFQSLDYETFPLNDKSGTLEHNIPANCAWSYVLTELQVAGFPGVTLHTSEGVDDRAHAELECERTSFNGARDYVEHNVGHIHIIAADATDYYDLARDHAKMVWSPRSNIALYGNTGEAQVMARLGGTVALGTDWTYSGSANMQRELACASSFNATYLDHAFTDEDLWKMATINAAIATDSDRLIGSLEVGKLADIAVFRAQNNETYAAVLKAQEADTLLVVRDGNPLYGEDDVVGALNAGCEAVTICSEARRICAMSEFGDHTFAQLAVNAAAVSPPAYAAEICDPPPDEPTCIPSRPGEYDGTITATDSDGDGIADTSDDCPTVFNPVRPMDHNGQADVDGDGIGDACDTTPVGDDIDGDGIPNATDLCPFLSDNPETDTDGDLKGDACDACPAVANMSHVCFPAYDTIENVQNGTIATNSNVFLHGTVTAIAYNGFFLEDPAGGAYSGVFVFGSEGQVAVGDDVSVAGKDQEYFGMTEIGNSAVFSPVPGGVMPSAEALTVAAAADPMWDGVLVKLTDISAINLSYDCHVDNASCGDTNLWELNSTIVAWDGSWQGTNAEWTAEGAALQAGQPITGAMGFRFNRVRIEPRTGPDIGPN